MKHLNNNRGSATPLILAITFSLLCLIGALYQNYLTIAAVRNIYACMEKTALTAIARQSEATYSSKRESYHGGYSSNDWSEWIVDVDAPSKLNEMLQITRSGDTLVSYTGSDLNYRITDVTLSIQNPALAESTKTLKASISLSVELPVKFGTLQNNVTVPLSVTVENKPKF